MKSISLVSPIKIIILIALYLCCSIECKSYILASTQYQMTKQKPNTQQENVKIQYKENPIFITLKPNLRQYTKAAEQQAIQKNAFVNDKDVQIFKERQSLLKKDYEKEMMHSKLENSIKFLIKTQKSQTECLFDEGFDICVIKQPTSIVKITAFCQFQANDESENPYCLGQYFIRQAQVKDIPYEAYSIEQKTKYQSGLFLLPQTQTHSIMLITCQDDDLPVLRQQLNVYSNVNYTQHDSDALEQTKILLGFDKSEGLTQRYIYLQVKEQSVRKCVQFEYYVSNSLVNGRSMLDYVNMTDSQHKNIFQLYDIDKKQSGNFLKYNMQISLNIFKPKHLQKQENFDVRVKIIDTDAKAQLAGYLFPQVIRFQNLNQNNNIYSRLHHYHYTYVVGHQVVKSSKKLQLQVQFQGRQSHQTTDFHNNFFFVSITVDDIQNMVVEKLGTSYVSLKKGEHLNFIIQQPYQVTDIFSNGRQVSDLIQLKPFSQVQGSLVLRMTQHSSDHQHNNQCHFSQGCKFQLQAKADCLECRVQYKGDFIKGPQDIMLLQIRNDKFKGKIDLDQTLFFYYEAKPKQIVELIVNTPNVIIYTLQNDEKKKHCKFPKKSCHSQVVTSHQPIILDNHKKLSSEIIYLAVEGLDKTSFSLDFISSQDHFHLENGESFSYKLPSENVFFEMVFDIPDFDREAEYDKNVSINLISPLNSLELDISKVNRKGTQVGTINLVKTMSGYTKIRGKQITEPQLKIIITKTQHYQHHPVHFTIVVSTSDHKYKLDTGITHYETFDPHEFKTYIIQFISNQMYSLNMHTYDTSGDSEQINLSVTIFNSNPMSDKKYKFSVAVSDFNLYLNEDFIEREQLCPDNDLQCELFIKVTSLMDHQVEMAFTLFSQDSVIELKDGIWESYRADDLLTRAHFFFMPTHQNKPVKIFFKSGDPRLSLYATLYDSGRNSNPAEWPFPQTHAHGSADSLARQPDQSFFKTNELVEIDQNDPLFKKCFPNCVVLISIKDERPEQALNQNTQTMSILASNNEIQLPQKQRLVLQLKKNEEQLIFVNMRHAFAQKKQYITFFTNFIVGYASVYGKIYRPSIQSIPDTQQFDFMFDPIKTQFQLSMIEEFVQKNGIDNNDQKTAAQILQRQQLYVALLVKAQEDTKMTLEFTTEYDQIQNLQIDSSVKVELEQGQQRLFQFIPTRDEKIKFIRNIGYPLFYQFKCQETDYETCIDEWLTKLKLITENDIRNIKKQLSVDKELSETPKLTSNKVKQFASLSEQEHLSTYQILQRTQTIHTLECQKCVTFIWIYALEKSQFTIQLQSLLTEVGLKENQLLNDFLEIGEFHRYYLSRVQKEYTTVVVNVNEGDIQVIITDNLNYENSMKSSTIQAENGRKVLLFKIPPTSVSKQTIQRQGAGFNSLFSNLHLSITAQGNKAASYTILYSSGSHQVFLQNGVISTQFIFADQITTLYYQNPNYRNGARSYLTMTAVGTQGEIFQFLQDLTVRMFSVKENPQTGERFRTQLSSQLNANNKNMKLKKVTTLTFQVPPIENIQIQITSKITNQVTLGISDGKMIFLPLNYEYPLFIAPKEEVHIVIENIQESYVEFKIKKCDSSNPYIFYTNDEQEFRHDTYGNYDRFGSQTVFKHVSKTKNKGILYLKIKAQNNQKSILLIESNYVDFERIGTVDTDPGNQGVIAYELQSHNQAKITFTGLQCGKSCIKNTQFYLIRSKSLPNLHSQMTCVGQQIYQMIDTKQQTNQNQNVMFSLGRQTAYSSQTIVQKLSVTPNPQSNVVETTINIDEEHTFLTIKAVYVPSSEEIYYKPIQMKTIGSTVKSLSTNILWEIVGALGLVIILVIWLTKIWARKGYLHVGDEQMMIA